MVKQISPNNLAENRSESKYISEEDLLPLVEKETLERYLDNTVEPYYLFKGAVVSLFFCLPFWMILFWLIAWLLIRRHFLKLVEVKWSNYLLLSPQGNYSVLSPLITKIWRFLAEIKLVISYHNDKPKLINSNCIYRKIHKIHIDIIETKRIVNMSFKLPSNSKLSGYHPDFRLT